MHSHFFYHDKKIYYKIEGKGKAIVLLHGFLEGLYVWEDYMKELSKNYTVLTIDLPGHGDSECISEVHDMTMMSEVVASAIYINNISQCILIGHSMGGYVMLKFADKYPNLLKGFGLLHSHALPDSEEGKANRNRVIEIVSKNHKNFISQFFPELFASANVSKFKKEIDKLNLNADKITKESIIAATTGMRDREDKLNVLTNSKVPVLFIFGRQDKRLPIDVALKQASLPANSEIHILANAAHMGFIEEKHNTLLTISSFAQKYL